MFKNVGEQESEWRVGESEGRRGASGSKTGQLCQRNPTLEGTLTQSSGVLVLYTIRSHSLVMSTNRPENKGPTTGIRTGCTHSFWLEEGLEGWGGAMVAC